MKKFILILLVVFTKQLIAQQIVTDRPDQTEASTTVPKGSLQIESGIFVGFTETNTNKEKQLFAPTTLFRFGITKGIEIRVLSQLESIKNQLTLERITGISDIEIGTKIQILKKKNINTEIAFLSHLIIPTGSTGLTTIDKYGTINKLSISHKINDNLGVGYNIGYDYFGIGKGNLTYSLSLAISVTDKVGVFIEPYGEITDFKNYLSNFDSGFTYLVKDNFQLDFSFGTGINNKMNFISTGFSWNINKNNQNK